MKKVILMWLMSQRQGMDRAMKKKILISLGIFSLFVVVGFGLLTYAGVKAIGYVFSKVPSQEQALVMTQKLSSESTLQLSKVSGSNCWSVAMNHLNISVWFTQSISENVSALANACLVIPEVKPAEKNTGT